MARISRLDLLASIEQCVTDDDIGAELAKIIAPKYPNLSDEETEEINQMLQKLTKDKVKQAGIFAICNATCNNKKDKGIVM